MKMKLIAESFLLCWMLFNSFNSTQAAMKISSRLKTIRHPQKFNVHHHQNDMKVHIKKVLNMHFDNATMDKYISSIFNLNIVNPTYIFRLPDQNRSLVFRKTDFSVAVFPNITNVNKFTKSSNSLQMSSSKKRPVKVKNEEVFDELKHESSLFDDDNADDDDNKKIVDENVRSERDFIDLMNDLNKDLIDEDNRSNFQKLTQSKPSNSKKQSLSYKKKHFDDEWEELGLSGWTGTVAGAKDKLPKREKPKPFDDLKSNFNVFDPFGYLKNYNQSSPEDEIDDIEEVSDQLSSILLQDEQILLNKTGRLPNNQPRWPITTTRDKHGDNDVFLARANNPFGHSTKWKYNNSSVIGDSHREGRSKRGVLHLYSMIKCATGCDPLIYKGYGCYCGFLGSGRALDGIDRCCKAHDYCYTSANCIFYTEYFVPYLWKCYRGKPLCAIDNGEWGGPGSCPTRLCQCDLALSKCLRHHFCPKKRPVCVSSPFRLLQNLVMVF